MDTGSLSTQLASSPLLLAGEQSLTTGATRVTTPTLTLLSLLSPTVTMVSTRGQLVITSVTVMLCLVVVLLA